MVGTGVNISAMIGMAAMNRASREYATSLERLATGKKINRASDDPAGAVVAESMSAELRTVSKQIDGLEFEDKRLGALDGAQSVLSDLLFDLSGLVGESASRGGRSQKELEANQDEADSILKTIDHIAGTTTFNGERIIQYLDSKGLGVAEFARGGKLNLVSGDAEAAQKTIDDAINSLAVQRAGAGIRSKDIQSNIRTLQEKFQDLSAAKSQIEDTDFAAETSKMVRAGVLQEAARFVTQLALKQNADSVSALLTNAIKIG